MLYIQSIELSFHQQIIHEIKQINGVSGNRMGYIIYGVCAEGKTWQIIKTQKVFANKSKSQMKLSEFVSADWVSLIFSTIDPFRLFHIEINETLFNIKWVLLDRLC